MIQKSYLNEFSNLYLVPTPIGNLNDISNRCIEILEKVDFIYAEDTRVSLKLLNSLNIKNKLNSCHKFNEMKVSKDIINRLSEGKNIAIVTDRGTPLISDPGYKVVNEVINAGYNVISLPGPCAFVPAICMSGLDTTHFLFYGFLNSNESQSTKELQELSKLSYTFILYESPYRLLKTLNNILEILGNRNICIAREISKIHEEIFRGKVLDAINYYKDIKGEIVIIIEANTQQEGKVDYLQNIQELVDYGMSSTNAIKYVAKKYNVSKNKLYTEFEEKKK